MEQSNNTNPLLDLLDQPAFFVKDGIITQANRSAEQKLIWAGSPIADLLGDHLSIYQQYCGGSLYMSVDLVAGAYDVMITTVGDQHLFCLEQPSQTDQALALAAQQLRGPLHTLFSATEAHPELKSVEASLYQLHRIINNMSDFPKYQDTKDVRLEATDLYRLISDTVEKSATLLDNSGIKLHYSALPMCTIGLANRELLERAIYNLISNAVKFSPNEGIVEVKLTQSGNMLYFTVQDHGDGIPPQILPDVFCRYHRSPGIEDSRYGVGLGLALVRMAAACHKGTVLIDQPVEGGTRVTMTLTVFPVEDNLLCSPVSIPFNDYASGRDHGLLELSDVLSPDTYKQK